MCDKKIKVSIIIPHYNQKECLQRLFPTIIDQTFKDFEVILIDDCTPDETAITFVRDFIKDKPNMHLVQNTVNLRFVKTCNKGITLAKGEYLCFLNQDTEIKNTFVQRNVEILDSDPTIGGLTCVVVDQFGQNWFSGGRIRNMFPHNLKDDFQGVRSVDFVAGTAAFYRKDVFDRVGLFDENYFMYHEDVEFGLRIKQQTDYRLCTFSDKLVTHILVPSMPRSDVYYCSSRNLVLLSRKYAPQYLPRLIIHIMVYFIANNLIRASLHMLTLKTSLASRRMGFAVASLRGTIHGIMAGHRACTDIIAKHK
jgi:GT2 family glycosyltransferase